MYDCPDSIRKNTRFRKLFSSRTGPKWYLALMPVMGLPFYVPTPAALIVPLVILPMFLLAAAFASRLNDIGWPRWHAAWLMAWAVLAKLILMAPVGPALSLHARQQAFTAIGWPFLAVALLLAVPRGERTENRFGPPPLGWREYWRARAANKAFLKAYRRSQPVTSALMKQMLAAQEISARLSKEYLDELNRSGIASAQQKKGELDAAREQFNAIRDQVTAAQAELKPSMEAAQRSQQRIRQVVAYKARG